MEEKNSLSRWKYREYCEMYTMGHVKDALNKNSHDENC